MKDFVYGIQEGVAGWDRERPKIKLWHLMSVHLELFYSTIRNRGKEGKGVYRVREEFLLIDPVCLYILCVEVNHKGILSGEKNYIL